jgi:hypothetical protein
MVSKKTTKKTLAKNPKAAKKNAVAQINPKMPPASARLVWPSTKTQLFISRWPWSNV